MFGEFSVLWSIGTFFAVFGATKHVLIKVNIFSRFFKELSRYAFTWIKSLKSSPLPVTSLSYKAHNILVCNSNTLFSSYHNNIMYVLPVECRIHVFIQSVFAV